jgi:hypothetical protein
MAHSIITFTMYRVDESGNAYLLGVFIHRSNKNGFAGTPVSKGCLLIAPGSGGDEADWTRFNDQMAGVKNFKVEIDRSTQDRQPDISNEKTSIDTYYCSPLRPWKIGGSNN